MRTLSLLYISTVSGSIIVIMSQTATATIELHDIGTSPPAASILQVKNTSTQRLTDRSLDSSETQTLGEESSLPPVDRGRDAWLFLAACWVVEAITFGEL